VSLFIEGDHCLLIIGEIHLWCMLMKVHITQHPQVDYVSPVRILTITWFPLIGRAGCSWSIAVAHWQDV